MLWLVRQLVLTYPAPCLARMTLPSTPHLLTLNSSPFCELALRAKKRLTVLHVMLSAHSEPIVSPTIRPMSLHRLLLATTLAFVPWPWPWQWMALSMFPWLIQARLCASSLPSKPVRNQATDCRWCVHQRDKAAERAFGGNNRGIQAMVGSASEQVSNAASNLQGRQAMRSSNP